LEILVIHAANESGETHSFFLAETSVDKRAIARETTLSHSRKGGTDLSKVTQIVEELLAPILDEMGLELVDIEYKKEGSNWFLRIFIDNETGNIDIDDCGTVSERLSQKLDEKDPIPNAYFLEVSSPGAERPLRKESDFRKAVGRHVHITTKEPIGGATVIEGELLSFENGELTVKEAKKTHVITLEQIDSARMAIVF
jgi:ribosome maturation factor RimP